MSMLVCVLHVLFSPSLPPSLCVYTTVHVYLSLPLSVVQPWPPEPKKGEDTELEQSKWLNMLDRGRTWERVSS